MQLGTTLGSTHPNSNQPEKKRGLDKKKRKKEEAVKHLGSPALPALTYSARDDDAVASSYVQRLVPVFHIGLEKYVILIPELLLFLSFI